MKKITKITAFILLIFSVSIYGQKTDSQVEQELLGHIKNIEKWSSYSNDYDEALVEKLEKENETFKEKLLKYAATRPSMLTYEFPELGEHLSIVTSEDGNFRIYSWDRQTGGTMHFYENVFQAKTPRGKLLSKSFDDEESEGPQPKSFITDIFTLLRTKKSNIYIVRQTGRFSTSQFTETVELYNIGDTALHNVSLFKTKNGTSPTLGFQYDFFSVADREERPIKLIVFDKRDRSIKIPVVIEDEKNPLGRVTDKFIVYKFDGSHFVKTGYTK